MPTDTILGLVGSALRRETVERIYEIRKRDRRKPLIVLIASTRDLARFGITPSPRLAAFLGRVWPGPAQPSRKASADAKAVADKSAGAVSVVLACPGKKFRYLHRGTETVAFRVPKPPAFRRFLTVTGPLVAPSANFAGEPPAKTIAEARRMFGNKVDAYLPGVGHLGRPKSGVPGRTRSSAPSLVVRILRC